MDPLPPADAIARRAAVHAALGDPVRLAIVDDLVRSDRTPSELTGRTGLASNLLAHHLAVLERVGLVERIVSSGDRRRRYVRALPLAFAVVDLGDLRATRHEGGSHDAGPDDPGATAAPAVHSALFVCTHNSARSQLAAALWRDRTGADATSAGTHPAERVHPAAVAAASRLGLDLAEAIPRVLEPGELEAADLVITVCDRAHEEVTVPDTALHWSIPDPVGADISDRGVDPFDLAAALLDQRISATVALSRPTT